MKSKIRKKNWEDGRSQRGFLKCFNSHSVRIKKKMQNPIWKASSAIKPSAALGDASVKRRAHTQNPKKWNRNPERKREFPKPRTPNLTLWNIDLFRGGHGKPLRFLAESRNFLEDQSIPNSPPPKRAGSSRLFPCRKLSAAARPSFWKTKNISGRPRIFDASIRLSPASSDLSRFPAKCQRRERRETFQKQISFFLKN